MLSQTRDAFSSAPMPNSDKAMINKKPIEPPKRVCSVFRLPCSAPWVSASRLFGPGESDKPSAAAVYSSPR